MQENQNRQFKSGFATLIGRPNVGKSTLMNALVGQKIAITSNKPQTTRNRIQTVYTSEEGQIVFLDTPGIHKAKNKLGSYMVNVAERTMEDVDVILWLVEPTDYIGAGEQHIIEQLKRTKTPVILVINKIDTVQKELILTYIDAYRKQLDFAEIVPVSALKKDGMEVLIGCIMKYLPDGALQRLGLARAQHGQQERVVHGLLHALRRHGRGLCADRRLVQDRRLRPRALAKPPCGRGGPNSLHNT